jgi:hypothetical protein
MDLKSLAKIGKGTRRKKRDINLLEVAEGIRTLYDIKKSLDKVADIVKLSPEMVREFLKVTKLDEKVKKLIRNNLIKGVDIAYRISKLSKKNQILLAKQVVDKNLSSDDVRAIIKYNIDNPRMSIERATNRVIRSKTKKVYVAYLGIEKDTFEKLAERKKNTAKIIRSLFNGFLCPEFIISFELNGRVVILKVSKEGLQAMRAKARELKIPLAKLADALLKEYLRGIK